MVWLAQDWHTHSAIVAQRQYYLDTYAVDVTREACLEEHPELYAELVSQLPAQTEMRVAAAHYLRADVRQALQAAPLVYILCVRCDTELPGLIDVVTPQVTGLDWAPNDSSRRVQCCPFADIKYMQLLETHPHLMLRVNANVITDDTIYTFEELVRVKIRLDDIVRLHKLYPQRVRLSGGAALNAVLQGQVRNIHEDNTYYKTQQAALNIASWATVEIEVKSVQDKQVLLQLLKSRKVSLKVTGCQELFSQDVRFSEYLPL